MMGRDAPRPGLEKTARYVADQLKKLGLKPGDSGTWFQRDGKTFQPGGRRRNVNVASVV